MLVSRIDLEVSRVFCVQSVGSLSIPARSFHSLVDGATVSVSNCSSITEPLSISRMIDESMSAHVEQWMPQDNRNIQRENKPVPLRPPQILRWTLTFAAKSHKLTVGSMARLFLCIYLIFKLYVSQGQGCGWMRADSRFRLHCRYHCGDKIEEYETKFYFLHPILILMLITKHRLEPWGASSPLCWFNNKEFCVLHVQSNTTI